MKVDISPNFPPSSSCTAAAEFGDGFRGRGRSMAIWSKRVIMAAPIVEEEAGGTLYYCGTPPATAAHQRTTALR
jgi:hypothetical protein